MKDAPNTYPCHVCKTPTSRKGRRGKNIEWLCPKHMPKQCIEIVYGPGTFGGAQCSNPGKIQHGNVWYCAVHDPDKVAERKRKLNDKWKAEDDAARALYEKERTDKRIGELMQKLATDPHELYMFADGSISICAFGGKVIADGNTLLEALEKWDSEQ